LAFQQKENLKGKNHMQKLILATLAGLLISSTMTLAQSLTPSTGLTTASAALKAGANAAPSAARNGLAPYVGIGIGLRQRYYRLENAVAELVKQNGPNVTSDMALDATARAADPTLPPNATRDQKINATKAYLQKATYSDDVAAECNLVFTGAPAEKAGIKQSDLIVAIDNKSINGLDASGLIKALKDGGPAGSSVSITVLRKEPDGSKSTHVYTVVRGTVTPH
jgi:C-terminal processing protease CtpA/Prc